MLLLSMTHTDGPTVSKIVYSVTEHSKEHFRDGLIVDVCLY